MACGEGLLEEVRLQINLRGAFRDLEKMGGEDLPPAALSGLTW